MRACQPKDLKGREWRSAWERGEREGEREKEGMHRREEERARFGSSFYVFVSPWACPMQIGLSQECCLFYLRSSL